jgi:hypothetical protein
MTKAQRRKISLRNLAKARKASRKGTKRKSAPAKRRSVRKAGKRTIAIRNLAKARSARRRNKARGGPKHRVAGYAYKRPAKTVRVKSHMSYEKPRRRRKAKRHVAEAAETPRKSRRRRSSGRRRLSMKKSAVAARRRRRMGMEGESRSKRRRAARKGSRKRGRRHSVRGHYARRGGKRIRVKKHMSAETPRKSRRRKSSRRRSSGRRHHMVRRRSRGYSMENPLTPMEMGVGAVTGVLGFLAADALDRVIATHALRNKTTNPVAGDSTTGTWADDANGKRYPGLYNATAVLAPMDWQRWMAGAGITAVPFIVAAFIKSPVGRSSLQFFGFGAGVRILGKAATDLMAKLTAPKYSWGTRLYDGEARAAAAAATGDPTGGGLLPSSGLGALPEGLGSGCGCANCVTGVGACCRFSGQQSATFSPVVGGPLQPQAPSPSGQAQPPAPQPPMQPQLPPVQMTPSPAVPPYTLQTFSPPAPPAMVNQPRQSTPATPPTTTTTTTTTSNPGIRVPGQVATRVPLPSPPSRGIQGTPSEPRRRSRYDWGTSQQTQGD